MSRWFQNLDMFCIDDASHSILLMIIYDLKQIKSGCVVSFSPPGAHSSIRSLRIHFINVTRIISSTLALVGMVRSDVFSDVSRFQVKLESQY